MTLLGLISFIIHSCSTKMNTVERENGEKKIYNLRYGSNPRNIMDVFIPANLDKQKPVAFIIHGGAWVFGNKSHVRMFQRFFQKNGIASVNINYSLVDKNTNINHVMKDVEKAINRSNLVLDSLKIPNQQYIFLGESAGGHIAMLYAYQNPTIAKKVISLAGPTDFYSETFLQSNYFKRASPTFEKVVGEKYNLQEISENFKKASPLYHVSNVPTLIFQGGKDHLVDKTQSIALAKKLQEKGVEHELIYMEKSMHAPRVFKNPRENIIYPKILEWFSK